MSKRKLIYRYYLIDEFLEMNNITKKQLCKMCKISLTTLYKFYHGESVYISSLLNLVNVLNVKVYEFLIGFAKEKK